MARTPATDYNALIQQAAKSSGIPPAVLYGVIRQESGFNPNARSKAGAQGIAQFMPATAARFRINPYDPNQAIPAAAKYLRSNFDKFGNWHDAVGAYNAGEGNIAKVKAGRMALPAETANYIPSVMRFANSYDGSVYPTGSGQPVPPSAPPQGLFASMPRPYREPIGDGGWVSRYVAPENTQEEAALDAADALPPDLRNGATRAVAVFGANDNSGSEPSPRLTQAARALTAMGGGKYA